MECKDHIRPAFAAPNFEVSEYADGTGRKLPMFLLSKDGFGTSNFGVSSYLSEQNKEFPMYVMSKDGFNILQQKGREYCTTEVCVFTGY